MPSGISGLFHYGPAESRSEAAQGTNLIHLVEKKLWRGLPVLAGRPVHCPLLLFLATHGHQLYRGVPISQ